MISIFGTRRIETGGVRPGELGCDLPGLGILERGLEGGGDGGELIFPR